jgi:hypothetical protein
MGRIVLLFGLAVCATVLFFARVELPLLSAHPDREAADPPVVAASAEDRPLTVVLYESGYHPSADEVIALHDAGVDTDLVVAVRRSGLERPSGVDGDLIEAAVRSFGPSTSVSDIVALHDAGVDADYIEKVAPEGRLSVRDVIRLYEAGVDN